jgi:hypothetical protein
MVDSSCATFISGPFRPPRALVRAAAFFSFSMDMPST